MKLLHQFSKIGAIGSLQIRKPLQDWKNLETRRGIQKKETFPKNWEPGVGRSRMKEKFKISKNGTLQYRKEILDSGRSTPDINRTAAHKAYL